MSAPRRPRPATRWLFGRVLEMHVKLPKGGGEVSCYPGTERLAALMGCSRDSLANLIQTIKADDKETIRCRRGARRDGSVRREPNRYTWRAAHREGWYVDNLRRLLALFSSEAMKDIGSTPRAALAAIVLHGRGFPTQADLGKEIGLTREKTGRAIGILADAGLLRQTQVMLEDGYGRTRRGADSYEVQWMDGWRSASPGRHTESHGVTGCHAAAVSECDDSGQDLDGRPEAKAFDPANVTKTGKGMRRKPEETCDDSGQDLSALISLPDLGVSARRGRVATIKSEKAKQRNQAVESIRAVLQVANPKLDAAKVAGRLWGIMRRRWPDEEGICEIVFPQIASMWDAGMRDPETWELRPNGEPLKVDDVAELLALGSGSDCFEENVLWRRTGAIVDSGHPNAQAVVELLLRACRDKSLWPEVEKRIEQAEAA